MKKNTLPTLIILLLCFFSGQLNAQDGYTYTLVDNGALSFSIAAVPNASASNFASSVQSYGFTIIVPDGVTLGITSSLGSSASHTFFDGTAVGMPTIDGYLITEVLGSPAALPAPSAGTTTTVVTIQVSGSPTTGMMYLLANNSALATTVTPLKSFMQADMVDDAMVAFTNVVDPNASGLSGTLSHMFTTLSTPTSELVGYSISPNPATDVVNITGLENDLTSIEIYNVTGQKVLTATNNLESFNVSAFQTGVYFVQLNTETASKTIKLVKKD
ncbi:T9SS type A sorting domain-containing protein [Lacinutrix jangbogonensis]|uniref:T9SS type A sorting domain-containing protein n=1 Tax=Lacinutrix jangbogonensis TaxID=1469557 RepID=UPI00068F39FB|nr:T9SS type A sorting domain-containing protein [Lacinutrix jangbogonensis]